MLPSPPPPPPRTLSEAVPKPHAVEVWTRSPLFVGEARPSARIHYEDPSRLDDPRAVHVVSYLKPKYGVLLLTKIGMAKCALPPAKSLLLGAYAGLCVAFGGVLAITGAAGLHISADPRVDTTTTTTTTTTSLGSAWPGVDRIVLGLLFPVALVLITITGTELFTGNALYTTLAVLARRSTRRQALQSLCFSYVGNLCGCLLGAYAVAYETDLLTGEPFAGYTRYLAVAKTSPHWARLLLRAIPANMLVCFAVWTGISADSMGGKIIGMWVSVATFAICGFEHCVANMFFIPLGLLNGANVTIGTFIIHNLLPVTLGNLLGAGVFVGLFFFYVYEPHMTRQLAALRLKYNDNPVTMKTSSLDATRISGGAGPIASPITAANNNSTSISSPASVVDSNAAFIAEHSHQLPLPLSAVQQNSALTSNARAVVIHVEPPVQELARVAPLR